MSSTKKVTRSRPRLASESCPYSDPPLLRNNTQDSPTLTKHLSSSKIFRPRPRLNTFQNEEQLALRKSSHRISKSKLTQMGSLSPVKYYESKLTLSCQSWSAYSTKQAKYKRGYRPCKVVHFNGFFRLLLLKIYLKLQQTHPAITTVSIRANRFLLLSELLTRQKSLTEQKKLQSKRQKQPDPYILAQNTIIGLKDLVMGVLYTEFQDLTQYAVIFLGAALRDIDNSQNLQRKTHALDEPTEGKSCKERRLSISSLLNYAERMLALEGYTNTTITKRYELLSSPEELTRIMADFVATTPNIHQLLSKQTHSCCIKYQLGYKFYQDRTLKFTSCWPVVPNHLILTYKGWPNLDLVSYNLVTGNVIAINDCKMHMGEIDLKRIEDFLEGLAKPIVVYKGTKQRKDSTGGVKLPVLRLSET